MDEQSLTEEEQAKTPRERVLEAALKLFVEQGYFKTNIPDISSLSNCSVGSIYHHFLNKEEIARELYASGIRDFRHELAVALDDAASLENNIYALVRCFCEFSESHQLLARYIWLARHAEFMTNKLLPPTTVGFDMLGRKLTRMIKRGINEGQIPEVDAEVVWTKLFGMSLSFIRDWLDGYTKNTPTQVAQTLAQASWQALGNSK